MPTIRVKLDPLPAPELGRAGVSGVSLGLVRRGPDTTLALRDSQQAATITFQLRLLPTRSSGLSERVEPLARLVGEIALDVGTGAPLFTLSEPSAALVDLSANPSAPDRRPLRVELDQTQFVGSEQLPGPLLVFLPSVSRFDFAHAEIQAALEIAGGEEAALDDSDTLDVPLAPRPRFTLRVVDELGEPLAGAALEFSILGSATPVTTDEDGFAQVDDLAADAAAVRFTDAAAVKAELKQRWSKPRVGAYVHAAASVAVIPLSAVADGVMVQARPQQLLSIQPRVVQARITGTMFDTNKSFLLPPAIPSLRELAQLYQENPGSKLLIVGHTDTTGDVAFNDSLSIERVESVAAYLLDDVATWLGRYAKTIDVKRRWGSTEDLLMLSGLTPGAVAAVLDANTILAFQRSHNQLPSDRQSKTFATLPENGELDEATRRQLIGDYMNQDDTTLPEDVELSIHGCGEHFPLAADSDELDSAPVDGAEDGLDRRVELFFFEPEFGVQPPPPSKNSKKDSLEYPEWRRRARETRLFDVTAHGPLTIGTFAPADDESFQFFIGKPGGEPLAVLTRDQGRVEDDSVSFDVVPELLPTSVQFRVERNGRVDLDSGNVDPVALRDALFRTDMDGAAFQVTTSTQGSGSGSPAGATTRASVAPRTPVDPANLPLFLVFHWRNPNHRFLRRMSFSLTALDGASAGQSLPEPSGSRLGFKTFSVPQDVNSIRLSLSVPSPRAATPILSLTQEYLIARSAGSKPGFVPRRSSIAGLDQHPRIESAAYEAGNPSKVVIAASLDLDFLDVTAHVEALGAGEGQLGEFRTFARQNNTGCTIRILEHTGGRPVTWPVILPPGLPDQTATNVLLFLKNEALDHVTAAGVQDGSYQNSDDANYTRALFGYWTNPRQVGKYVGEENDTSYDNYPQFGWDAQLIQSRKPVVVLFPIPHSTDFGVLDRPSADSKRLIESALRALYAERLIATGQRFAPFLQRLALGAWSSGTDTLYRWALPRKDLAFVDEIYAFDGKGPYPVDFVAWFDVDRARRRLCLIGSAYTEVPANQVMQRLNHPNVFIQPGNPRYWYENPGYLASLRRPSQPGPMRFRSQPNGAQLPADASTASNLFIESESLTDNGVFARRTITLFSPGLGRRTIGNVGHEEAAVFAVLEALGSQSPGALPIASQAEFLRVTGWIDQQPGASEPVRSFRHRHSWSMFGGLFGDRGRPFVGYFQACLERSGF